MLAVRGLHRLNPQITGTTSESIARWLGFFERPEPAEIIANYLRGYYLFGRAASSKDWFHWHKIPVRSVIPRQSAHLHKNRRRQLRGAEFEFHYDQDVEQIMRSCQEGRNGWLTDNAIEVYMGMHKLGLITSLGAYRDGQLVGGFWGLSLGSTVAMMSMFHRESNAGSLLLATLVNDVIQGNRWSLIDCGGPGEHWRRYGAQNLNVKQFSALVTSRLVDPEQKIDYSGWTVCNPVCEPIEGPDDEAAPFVAAPSSPLPSR
jgi:leucyl/phenylalanyl-tRNA--protein transferase